MTLPSRPRPIHARSVVAWSLAVLAAPLLVAVLRAVPPIGTEAAPWLPVAALAVTAALVAGATGRWLVDALRHGSRTIAIGAAAGAMVLAGCLTALVSGAADAPVLPLLAALAAVGVTWITAFAVHGSLGRIDRSVVALGVFLAFDAVVAASLFIGWTERGAPYVAAVAGAATAAASLLAARRGDRATGPLALMAGSDFGFVLARAASIEGVVALTALAAAAALLAAERPGAGEDAVDPARREGAPRLPEMAHDLAEGVLLFDAAGRLADWNSAAGATFDIEPDAAGTPMANLLEPLLGGLRWTTLPSEAGEAIRSRATLDGEAPRELTLVHGRDGTALLVARDLALERNETTEAARLGRELRGTIEELLEARRMVELQRIEIERAATIDPLTGVTSRRAMLQRLAFEVAEARRYAHPVVVVVVDVDGFAELNQHAGTSVGDAVLRDLALRLRLRMRAADALGRIDGDRFCAVLPHTDEAGAARFAESILRRLVNRPVMTDGGPLEVACSIGIAVMPAGMDATADELLAAADEALASARRGGGNRIAFDRRHGLARLEGRRDEAVTWEPDVEAG